MQLKKVDKARYRQHLNIVIIVSILFFAATSLGISQLLISLFPDSSGSHFHWNLFGVIVAGVTTGIILHGIRLYPFMSEVYYVWQLKQSLNKVTRKLAKIKKAAESGDKNAMTCLQFSYSGSRLLWELDDNNIVMDELTIAQAELDALAEKFAYKPNADDFSAEMLRQF